MLPFYFLFLELQSDKDQLQLEIARLKEGQTADSNAARENETKVNAEREAFSQQLAQLKEEIAKLKSENKSIAEENTTLRQPSMYGPV